jgi:hypothetical protein
MDLDYELQDSLEPYLRHGNLFFMYSSNTRRYLTNSLMASIKGHPIWKQVLQAMEEPLPWWAIGRHLRVIMSTGPGKIDAVVRSSGYTYSILPDKINPYNICDNCPQVEKEGAILVPLEGQSWVTWDTRLYGSWYCYSYYWLSLLLIMILLIGILIYKRR